MSIVTLRLRKSSNLRKTSIGTHIINRYQVSDLFGGEHRYHIHYSARPFLSFPILLVYKLPISQKSRKLETVLAMRVEAGSPNPAAQETRRELVHLSRAQSIERMTGIARFVWPSSINISCGRYSCTQRSRSSPPVNERSNVGASLRPNRLVDL